MGDTFSTACDNQTQAKHTKIFDQSVAITYENGNFNLPSKIPFQKQSTYAKIQKAAYNFCQQNSIDLDFMPCITRIIAYRQEKVFLAAFSRLPQSEKENFLQEVNRIPQDQIDLFYHNFVNETQKKYSLAGYGKKTAEKLRSFLFQMKEFKIPKYINAMEFAADQENKLYQKGKAIVQAGQVALVIMCAGCSSHFQNKDKFLSPIKLPSLPQLTILDLIFIRLTSSFQNKHLPIIVTCNQLNFKLIQNFFRQRKYYGFDKQRFRFMEVQCLPVLDLKGKYCINEKFRLIKRPFGTGRTVNQILKERNMSWLKQTGVKYVHFIGAQNLMEHPCDCLMLGVMVQKGKRICAKTVGTASQWQKLPRYVASSDNRVYIKFWSQLNSSISQSALYSAYKYPVATNSIIVQLQYLQQLVKDFYTDIYLSQNYHIIRKKEKMMSVSTGKVVTSESLTFQGDIRDLLACCDEPGLLYVDRNRNYVPVFSRKEEYPLEGSVEHFEEVLVEEYNRCGQIHQYIDKKQK